MDVRFLQEALTPYLYHAEISSQQMPADFKIALITDELLTEGRLSSEDTICICQARHLKKLLDCAMLSEGTTIVCSGYVDAKKKLVLPPTINLFLSMMGVFELYNIVQTAVYQYQKSVFLIRNAVFDRVSANDLLKILSLTLSASVFLLDEEFQVFERAELEDCTLQSADAAELWIELKTKGILSPASVKRMQAASQKENSKEHFLFDVVQKERVIGHIVLFYHPSAHSMVHCFFAGSDLCEIAGNYLVASSCFRPEKSPAEHLICDLIDRRIESEQKARERIRHLRLHFADVYYCIVIGFDSNILPANSLWLIRDMLEQIFPQSYSAIHDEKIVVIGAEDRDTLKLRYDSDALNDLLKKHHAHACISYRSRFYLSMSVLCGEASAALRLGKVFCEDESTLVYFFEDYQLYLMIEMCTHNVHMAYHNGNPLYLSSPYLLRIKRYDDENEDNLLFVLYTYLKNNQNRTRTSQELYIHRNTLIYKINKIEEILGHSLEDYTFQMTLQMSYFVVQYIEKVLHADPFDESRSSFLKTELSDAQHE